MWEEGGLLFNCLLQQHHRLLRRQLNLHLQLKDKNYKNNTTTANNNYYYDNNDNNNNNIEQARVLQVEKPLRFD